MDVVTLGAAKADAKRKYNPVADAKAERRPVCGLISHANPPGDGGRLSNGTDTGGNYRMKHTVIQSCHDIQVAFGNFQNSSGTEQNGNGNLTIKASFETPSGVFVPIYFNGSRTVVIEPGGLVWSDPVGLAFRAGETFFTRTYISVTSGTRWPVQIITTTADGEGGLVGTTQTDMTTSGTITASSVYAYSPFMFRATPNKPVSQAPVIGVIGDSIAHGTGDSTAPAARKGFVRKALTESYAQVMVPYESDTTPNWTYNTLSSSYQAPWGSQRRKTFLNGISHAIVELGRNSLNSTSISSVAGGQIAIELLSVWKTLAARGVKVYQTTITPQTTSTDAWATVGGQTIADANKEGNRVYLNDWLRDGAPLQASNTDVPLAAGTSSGAIRIGNANHPLVGIFEVADLAETARNSGIWKAGYTADGLHPNNTGTPALAPAITPSAFGPAATP